MDSNLITGFARKLGTNTRAATDQERGILNDVGIPYSLSSIVTRQWFDSYSDIDGVEIYDIGSICEEVGAPFIKEVVPAGFLPIGKAGNGDLLAIDFSRSDFPVVYVRSHKSPRKSFVTVSDSLVAFLERGSRRSTIAEFLFRRPRFPRDSYDAEEAKA